MSITRKAVSSVDFPLRSIRYPGPPGLERVPAETFGKPSQQPGSAGHIFPIGRKLVGVVWIFPPSKWGFLPLGSVVSDLEPSSNRDLKAIGSILGD